MRGARSAKSLPDSPLIASPALGTSPRGEKWEPAESLFATPLVEAAHAR